MFHRYPSILLEIQALICHSYFNNPRRTATGTDFNRVNLLMAVLEKRIGMQLSDCDAYVNIAGGIRMNEPAIDLGIVLAIMSSKLDLTIDEKTICFGEVGLSGEVRGVSMAEQRVAEAAKLGFEVCILPKISLPSVGKKYAMKLIRVANVRRHWMQFRRRLCDMNFLCCVKNKKHDITILEYNINCLNII